jgi:hypothetical protein
MPAGVLLTAQEAKEIGNLLLKARAAMLVNGRYHHSGIGMSADAFRTQCNRSARKLLGSSKTSTANGKR